MTQDFNLCSKLHKYKYTGNPKKTIEIIKFGINLSDLDRPEGRGTLDDPYRPR